MFITRGRNPSQSPFAKGRGSLLGVTPWRTPIARTLALDIGDKRIGVAVSDPLGMLATPLTIIERKDDATAVDAIARIVEEKQVARVIAGMPYALNGGVGHQAQKAQAFAEKLSQRLSVPLEFRDERLSTATARRLMREAASKKTRYARDDAFAAAVILQEYLDEQPGS